MDNTTQDNYFIFLRMGNKNKSTLEELKEVCNKIVGHWYCDQIKQHFIFDFNDKPLKMARLTVINTKTFETEYGVAIKINPYKTDLKTDFYFDVGKYEKRYYEILNLTKDMLVISEFFKRPDTHPLSPIIYVRQTDLSVADEILQGLDSI